MKPVPRVPIRVVRTQFPGEIAGASLKPASLVPAARPPIGNSPAKSPGPH